jgi:hypothetical protein
MKSVGNLALPARRQGFETGTEVEIVYLYSALRRVQHIAYLGCQFAEAEWLNN